MHGDDDIDVAITSTSSRGVYEGEYAERVDR